MAPELQVALTGLIGVLVGAFLTYRTTATNVRIENVTQNRREWRDFMRRHAEAIHCAALIPADCRKERLEAMALLLKLNVNPDKALDQEIWKIVRAMAYADADGAETRRLLAQFTDRLALLLKHDWERAKEEAGIVSANPIEPDYCKYRLRDDWGEEKK